MDRNQFAVYTITGALDLLKDRRRWTRGAAARNAGRQLVDPSDPTAIRWCAVGAVAKVGDDIDGACADPYAWRSLYDLLDRAATDLYPDFSDYVQVNDHRGYAAVKRVFRAALAMLTAYNVDNLITGC